MKIKSPFIFAPIADVTTPALRKIVRSFCKETIISSEMISAAALVRGGSRNEILTKKFDFDDPIIFQIIGNTPEDMAESVKILSGNTPYSIDINMGCSAPDITKRGWGSKLLTDFKLSKEIIKKSRKAAPGTLSVKMRAGYESIDKKFLLKFTTMLQDEGVNFITVHPRHGRMGFKRSADWSIISFLKDNLSIPIIGNGDIDSAQSALKRISDTGCDGVMIARKGIENPWIFKKCRQLYNNIDETFEVDIEQTAMDVLSGIEELLPGKLHKTRAWRFCGYYTKNLAFGHNLFSKIRHCEEIRLMKSVINDYFTRNSEEKIKTI